MNLSALSEVLQTLRMNRDFMSNVVAWERMPARPGLYAGPASALADDLLAALDRRGIRAFYAHQAAAIDSATAGDNLVVATATASGKSLCYTVPVLQRLLVQPKARALYLFPTKALAHDQVDETAAIVEAGRLRIPVHSYDGDTPRAQRSQIRQSTGILVTNPDMLHSGILPFHPNWRLLFSNLQFVVLDEIHAYRGIFGSHVANVIRRLRRICRFYGSDPQFICCSATIANPQEHAERLIEAPVTLIDDKLDGAPAGQRHMILFNPPMVDEELGLRRSTVLMTKDAAAAFLAEDVPTIVFARARQTVELLLTYLQDDLVEMDKDPDSVAGYRGGYLPLERRRIEQGLRHGALRGVVATNALELGVDIGQLSAAVLCGYPGTIAATWQQAGRAGRRAAESAAMLIAGSNPLDQYICQHPRYLFGRSPEHALINPDNPRIVARHVACASFEIPFRAGEPYGAYGAVDDLLEELAAKGDLHATRGQYHWLGDGAPANRVSLRTGGDETVIIQDVSGAQPQVIGEIDLASVPLLAYEGAIYMHLARGYLVEELDWDNRLAAVRPVDVDYYTRASMGSNVRRLAAVDEAMDGDLLRAHGDVRVETKATSYRKIKHYSHETLGFGEIDLPAMTLDTSGYWIIFGEQLSERLFAAGVLLRPNDYGPNWAAQRRKALERDDFRCQVCGASGGDLHVHHIRPFRDFDYVRGENENYRYANEIDNLVTLCPSCHQRAEEGQRSRSALGGLGYVLRNLAPLFLMSDPRDIEVVADSLNPLTRAPTVVIYETVPAGVGFSEKLYELHHDLLRAARELIADCRCRDGCPACVGPPGEIEANTKDLTRQLLNIVLRAGEEDR